MTDFEIDLIKQANQDLQDELQLTRQQRDAALMKVGFTEEEIKVVGLKVGDDGKFDVQVSHSALELFAASLVDSFVKQGAVNFSSIGIRDPRNGDVYEVTMQKVVGKTPQMLFQESKRKIQELEATIERLEYGTEDPA